MSNKYLCHPIEKPVSDDDAKVDLIRSKDHPIMSIFYESAFYRKPYVICDKEYALPYCEFFCFMSTTQDDEKLGATVRIMINGEKFETDRAFMLQIPAFVPHGPIEITEMETPVFSYVTGSGAEHVGLPKESWKPENMLPIEDLVAYYNGNDGKVDPHEFPAQKWLIRSMAGVNTKGTFCGSIRRFYKTDGWPYAQDTHIHASPEILAYYGMDPWHPYDLNGTYTQYVNGKPLTIDKPTVVFVPAYVPHCPILVHKTTADNFWHSAGEATGPNGSRPGFALDYMTLEAFEAGKYDLEEVW